MNADSVAMVRTYLERILNAPLFRDTTRMKRFLRYVTEETLNGNGHLLKGYTIGVEVFDRPEDFDPQADTIVRVQAGQLRRRLDLYYTRDGENDPVRIMIPKGQYAPLFEFRRKPSDAVIADDKSEDAPVETPQGEGPEALIALIKNGDAKVARIGLVVTAFVDLTPDGSPDYFVEGLGSEIVAALVQFRHLRVISGGMAQVPTEEGSSRVETLGERYNAPFLLSGSVRMAGNVFRVTVNLTDTRTEQVLYTGNFDRRYTPDNIFEIEESVASNVAAIVAAPYGQINRYNRRIKSGRRQSIPAYEAVLRYYAMSLRPSRTKMETLLSDIENITEDFPNFSTGFAIRAILHVFLLTQFSPRAPGPEHLAAADTLSRRAVIIDRENAMAYFARFLALYHSGRVEESWPMIERAIALNSSNYAILAYLSIIHVYNLNFEAAAACAERVKNLIVDPPRWFGFGDLLMNMVNRKFDRLHRELSDVSAKSTVGLQLIKLSVLGHVGEIESGKAFFSEIADDPDIVSEWVKMTRYWQPAPALEEVLYEGWRKLGLNVPSD